eukprot:584955-Prymnesium_polylepis.1
MPAYRALLIGHVRTRREAWAYARACVDSGLDGIDLNARHAAAQTARATRRVSLPHATRRCRRREPSCRPSQAGELVTPELVEWLHARGKTVAVWVFRAPAANDVEVRLDALVHAAGDPRRARA